MRKTLLKVLLTVVSTILAVCLLSSCGYFNSSKFEVDDYVSGGAVSSNGGFVVEKGDFIYFINGSASVADDTINKYGNAVKSSLMRISKSDLNAGNYKNVKIIVPLMMVSADYSSGIYIYGDYVYYGTPSTERDKEGKYENNKLEFKRTKLDGSEAMSDYYFRSEALSDVYRFVEINGVVYCLHIYEEDIYSYNTATKTDTKLVSNPTSYMFDMTDITSGDVYYTMSVKTEDGVTASYNQIYKVSADATTSPYTYTFTEKDDAEDEEEETEDYVNFGTIVLDGIGQANAKTQFNQAKDTTPYAVDGYVYTLLQYKNGGLYYSRAYAKATSTDSDGGWLFYLPDAGVKADGANWNSVSGNAQTLSSSTDTDINKPIAFNTTYASASAMFIVNGENHSYIYTNGSDMIRADVNVVSGKLQEPTKTTICRSASSATMLYTDNNNTTYKYLYFALENANGKSLNRVAYNGVEENYNKIIGDDNFKAVKILNIDYISSWYTPEIINNKVFFGNAETDAFSYVYVVDLENKDGNLMTNAEIKTFNGYYNDVKTVMSELSEKYSNISNAISYYFMTGDKDRINLEIHKKMYSELELSEFNKFVNGEKSELYISDNNEDDVDDQFKDADGNSYRLYSYFMNRIGRMNDADAENCLSNMVSSYLLKSNS